MYPITNIAAADKAATVANAPRSHLIDGLRQHKLMEPGGTEAWDMTVIGRVFRSLLCSALLPLAAAQGQVLRAATMTTTDFAQLDRARTAVILPGGILEEHGPYLPSYSDGFVNERLAVVEDSSTLVWDVAFGCAPGRAARAVEVRAQGA